MEKMTCEQIPEGVREQGSGDTGEGTAGAEVEDARHGRRAARTPGQLEQREGRAGEGLRSSGGHDKDKLSSE